MLLRRLLSHFGYQPRHEAEAVRCLKRLAEQLNERGVRFRVVTERRVLLTQRAEQLETDWRGFERRAAVVQGDLAIDVARVCGRIEGQLQATQTELAAITREEQSLRELLLRGVRSFTELRDRARRLGHNVSECRLDIDLSIPEMVADESLLADDDRNFLARLIDGISIH